MKKVTNLILFTSGVDSYIGYYWLKHERKIDPLPVYVDIKSKYSRYEINHILKIMPDTLIIRDFLNLGDIEQSNGYIPNRNALIISAVVAYFSELYDQLNIFTGSLYDERISDQSKSFYKRLGNALSAAVEKPIKIDSAFAFKYRFTKRDAVNWYCENYNIKSDTQKLQLFEDLFSCYNPQHETECGQCKACFRKRVAFQDVYFKEFNNPEILDYYEEEIRTGQLRGKRAKDIKDYLDKLRK